VAADFCEEYEGFIFNHNEVILYKWVEEYEPALFARIQRLVKAGRWHIMGGWYLQPDCNMPSGESFVRQILTGKTYFMDKFGVEPTTAINLDPFGHTRGLVQILAKAGYDSYLHCRPDNNDCPLPDADYIWVGYDGSEVAGHRTLVWYGTPARGMIKDSLEQYLVAHAEREVGLVTWGIGNHGGGPSRTDLEDLAAIIKRNADFPIIHSTPESYFAELRERGISRQRVERDINPWAVGCYTSQVRLKQKHRLLENELYTVEKMFANASLQGLLDYPREDIYSALCDLMVAEFHDILPGSSVQAVEDAGLRLMDHGLEILSRLKARAFFAFAAGQPKADEDTIPVLVYNPHPFPIETTISCEFNLPDRHDEEIFFDFDAVMDGVNVPCQVEQAAGNIPLEWRKRCVYRATLPPSQMSRINCKPRKLEKKPTPNLKWVGNDLHFQTEALDVLINTETGLVDRFCAYGREILKPNAFVPLVMRDNEDPWSMIVQSYRDVTGRFALMAPEAGTRFSGLDLDAPLPSVRVVEDGPVRTVVEAVMAYNHSFLILSYRLPKQGTEVEIHVRVHWNEKEKLLKLAVPTVFKDGEYWGQVAYGRDRLPGNEREVVAQKWVAAVSPSSNIALTCINDGVYGSDFPGGEMRITLLRSPAYSAHPIGDRKTVPQDRYTPRIDQGERQFTFWINAGPVGERMTKVDREALVHNEKPMALSFYPAAIGQKPVSGITLSDDRVLLTAFKEAENGDGFILRLFEPTGTVRTTSLIIPALGMEQPIDMNPFEIKSFLLRPQAKLLQEVDLLERGL
jgi:alpha-mannosidase